MFINVFYRDTIYKCRTVLYMTTYCDGTHTLHALHYNSRGYASEYCELGVKTYSVLKDKWKFVGVAYRASNDHRMMDYLRRLHFYICNLDQKTMFYKHKDEIFRDWLRGGVYLDKSVFRLLIHIFLFKPMLARV